MNEGASYTSNNPLVAKAWLRIDTTKTEDMVPSSELRGWLAEYVSLVEQFETLREVAQSVDNLGESQMYRSRALHSPGRQFHDLHMVLSRLA